MVDVILKTDPLRPDWYVPEVIQSSGSPGTRLRVAKRSHVWRPPTDVYEVEEAVVVRVEIAGMREDDFSISLSGKILAIRGMRSDVPERRAYHQMEIIFGEFLSEVELPGAVIADEVKAEYKDGFLRLYLPKARSHKINIED